MNYTQDQKLEIVKMAMIYKEALSPEFLRHASRESSRLGSKLWNKADSRKWVPFLSGKKTKAIEGLARKRNYQSLEFNLKAMERHNNNLIKNCESIMKNRAKLGI